MHKFIPVSLIAFLLALAPTGGVAQDGASGPDGEEAYEAAIDAWALAQKEHRDAVMGADTDEEQEQQWNEGSATGPLAGQSASDREPAVGAADAE